MTEDEFKPILARIARNFPGSFPAASTDADREAIRGKTRGLYDELKGHSADDVSQAVDDYLQRGPGGAFINPAQLITVANRVRDERLEPGRREAEQKKYLQARKDREEAENRVTQWWEKLGVSINAMSDADLEEHKTAVLSGMPNYTTPDGDVKFFPSAVVEHLRGQSPRRSKILQSLIAKHLNIAQPEPVIAAKKEA